MASPGPRFLTAGSRWPVRSSQLFTVEPAAVGDTMAIGIWLYGPHLRGS
jgi:hypothetical protein